MLILGLTGSIGMGKSTTAGLFEEQGIPVFDSDACVKNLYAENGAAVTVFKKDKKLKKYVVKNKAGQSYIDSNLLKDDFFENATLKIKVEDIVHSLVWLSQDQFIADCMKAKYPAIILDIPLLYETNAEARCDAVIVVTAPKSIQRQRVLARQGFDETKFKKILRNQIPDAEKRKKANHIIQTGLGIGHARKQVCAVLDRLLTLHFGKPL